MHNPYESDFTTRLCERCIFDEFAIALRWTLLSGHVYLLISPMTQVPLVACKALARAEFVYEPSPQIDHEQFVITAQGLSWLQMDVGVGSFVVANGVVSREARGLPT